MPNALASALAANRPRFNAGFAEARHYKPALDGGAFADLLRTTVAPIVEAVHTVAPDSTYALTESLYDISLDLLAQDFLGPGARHPVIASGWTHLLPKLARFLAADPRAVVGAVTNALYNISAAPGARPGEWMRDMIALADHCAEVETLLKVGQILSWKSGLAHYRAAALDLLQTLPPALTRLILAIPADDSRPLDSVIDRLRANPWQLLITNNQLLNSKLHIVKQVGAFRGFGGLFIAPPVVFPSNDHFIVTDGEGAWLLTADIFGATFHRTTQPDTDSNTESPFTLTPTGEVKTPNDKRHFPELAQSTSHAANATTLAVTVPYSHAVYLVGL
ncbi:MAG TPA: hypothetical protein VJ020_07080, partial [Anaerolineales bacterium]|nr:hypothetical protein [Anaerolineales bacterium]